MELMESVELWMCRLAGLPVSESWDRPPAPPSKKQLAFTAIVLCGYALLLIYFTLILSQGDYNAFDTYSNLNGILYPASAIFVTLNMALADRSAPKRLSVRSKFLREAMMEHGLGVGATNLCRLVSLLLLAMALSSFCLDCIMDCYLTLYLDPITSALNQSIFLMLTVLNFPGELLYWTVLYRSASQPLAELGVIEDLIRELTSTAPEPEPEPVSAPEEDPGGLPWSQPYPMTVDRCRLLIEVCDQANKLRLESNAWLNVPSCIVMINSAWYLPIVFWGLNMAPEHVNYERINKAYVAIALVVTLAPCFCAQLVKFRREVLEQTAAREADRTADPDLKRALKKLKIHAKEMFPDCLCVLADIDLSFISVFINVVVLVTTTFFPRDGS